MLPSSFANIVKYDKQREDLKASHFRFLVISNSAVIIDILLDFESCIDWSLIIILINYIISGTNSYVNIIIIIIVIRSVNIAIVISKQITRRQHTVCNRQN
jgi:hypothetical protein